MPNGERNGAPPSIVIVDDHPLVGEALTLAALKAAPDADIRALERFDEALESLNETPADLVLLDLDLGQGGEWSPLITLVRDHPDTPVAMVSATKRPEIIEQARHLGAAGYLKKSDELTELGEGIASLLRGELTFPSALTEADDDAVARDAITRLASLTPTQARVLDGLRQGLLNKQIAYELDISVSTTKAHMTAIFRKLGVQNRTQALLVARHLDVDDDATAQS